MDHTGLFADGAALPAKGSRARRMLLEQVRFAITTEPATFESEPEVSSGRLASIRGRVSITVGAIVVRLNQMGFTQSDRLYHMRDGLAEGRPIARDDLEWLNVTIACEPKDA